MSVVGAMAPITVQPPAPVPGTEGRLLTAVDPLVGTPAQRAEHARHVAGAAIAPAAMTALLEAQEQMTEGASALAMTRTVRRIDHIITRVTDLPAAQVGAAAPADFSMQRLMAARQQLRQTFA